MRISWCVAGIALLGVCPGVLAAPAAVVEGLQMPAWVHHGDRQSPLQPAMELGSGARITTGAEGRVVLRLEEGSAVKLGADAELDLATLAPPADPTGVFEGVLNVVRGAFRFTTAALGRGRARHIQARVAAVTIGIRGTDVWGKAEPTRDFVVLLEGAIDIERKGETAQRMETPMTLFMAPKGAATLPITPVDPAELQRWAAETELQPGSGIVAAGGGWTLHLASYRQALGAARLLETLHAAGYGAQTSTIVIGGTGWTRVSLRGCATRADAEALRDRLRAQAPSAWIEAPR